MGVQQIRKAYPGWLPSRFPVEDTNSIARFTDVLGRA
jgi:hypothetical protein